MKSKLNQVISWNLVDLSGLLEDDDSQVSFERSKKHLALHPFHLTNLPMALGDILGSTLNFYDTEVKGFIIAYKNPTLLTSIGEAFNDTCFIHVDIEADFYVFRPKIGCTLKGIVKQKGLDHIVILVHKVFTVSIPRPFNSDAWPGDLVEIDQEVKCCVTHIDKSDKLPFIGATLNEDYLQGCRLSYSMSNIDNTDIDIKSSNNINESVDGLTVKVSDDVASEEDRKQKKKRVKKSKELKSESDIITKSETGLLDNTINSADCNVSNTDSFQNNSESFSVPKKRKKSKIISKELSDVELETNIKIKVEKPDVNTSSYNDQLDSNNINNVKSCKAIKLEDSVKNVTQERERKEKKKHKKVKQSNPESAITTKTEEEMVNYKIHNTDVKSDTKEYKRVTKSNSRKRNLSETSVSTSNSDLSNISKKRKKNTDVELNDYVIAIKTEKSDLVQDNINGSSMNLLLNNKNEDTQNLDGHIKTPTYIIEDSTEEKMIICDKERRKSPKKSAKKSRNSNIESEIKNEGIKTNNINEIDHNNGEQKYEHVKHDILRTDSSLNNSDSHHISKKHKKCRKSLTVKSESQLNEVIKSEIEDIN